MKRLPFFAILLTTSSALAQYYDQGMGYTPTLPPVAPNASQPPAYAPQSDYTDPYAYPGSGTQTSYGSSGGYSSGGVGGPSMLSYGFLEGGYQYLSPKADELDGAHGVSLALSAQLFKPIFLRAQFGWATSGEGSLTSREYDFTSVSLGGGAYIPISDSFHIVAEAGGIFGKLDTDRSFLSFTDSAFYVRPSLRFTPVPFLELQGGITLTSSDDFDSTIVDFRGYVRLFRHFDLGLGVDLGDEYTSFQGGLRVRW